MAKQTVFWNCREEGEGRIVLDVASARDAAEAVVDDPDFAGLSLQVKVWTGFHFAEPERKPDYEIDHG